MEEDVNKKQSEKNNKSSINKVRVLSVLVVLFVTLVLGYIILREKYIETLKIGEKYLPIFWTNVKYMISTLLINFLIIFFSIYITNKKIKNGFKDFFKKENREIPNLLNKTISFIGAILISMLTSNMIMHKAMLCINNAQFEIQDPVFNLDIGYFVFIKPFIEIGIWYFIVLVIFLLIYTVAYYIIGLNMFFDGVDKKEVKNSRIMKQIKTLITILTILRSTSYVL